jgi:hypothetical protein
LDDTPIATVPPSSHDKLLREKFDEHIAAQSDALDKLGQQLITLELAIPGLYATVLKLISGDKATLVVSPALFLAFGCWFVALALTLASLVPRKWRVNRNVMRQDPSQTTDELGIEDFFYKSAQYKRRLIIVASLFFFGGVVSAVLTIF